MNATGSVLLLHQYEICPGPRLYFYASPISLVYLIYLLMQDDFILSYYVTVIRAQIRLFIVLKEAIMRERER